MSQQSVKFPFTCVSESVSIKALIIAALFPIVIFPGNMWVLVIVAVAVAVAVAKMKRYVVVVTENENKTYWKWNGGGTIEKVSPGRYFFHTDPYIFVFRGRTEFTVSYLEDGGLGCVRWEERLSCAIEFGDAHHGDFETAKAVFRWAYDILNAPRGTWPRRKLLNYLLQDCNKDLPPHVRVTDVKESSQRR